jgi:putative ABC transport system substrate-binding protein
MTVFIGRREFITLLGGAAAAWPLAASAQQDGRVRHVGVLMPFAEANRDGRGPIQSFRQGLADLGWIEGRNVRILVGWAGPDAAAQRHHAHDLVLMAPEVILASGTIATQALRDATKTIPIVFVGLSDPVATGIVSNLARPEANVTGFTNLEHSMAGKWLSLLKEMATARPRRSALSSGRGALGSLLYSGSAGGGRMALPQDHGRHCARCGRDRACHSGNDRRRRLGGLPGFLQHHKSSKNYLARRQVSGAGSLHRSI